MYKEITEIQVYFKNDDLVDKFFNAVASKITTDRGELKFLHKISHSYTTPRLGNTYMLHHFSSFIILGFNNRDLALAALEILRDPEAIWAGHYYEMEYVIPGEYSTVFASSNFLGPIDIGDLCTHCHKSTAYGTDLYEQRIPSGTDTENGWMCVECQKMECGDCGKYVLDYELYDNEVHCMECNNNE